MLQSRHRVWCSPASRGIPPEIWIDHEAVDAGGTQSRWTKVLLGVAWKSLIIDPLWRRPRRGTYDGSNTRQAEEFLRD